MSQPVLEKSFVKERWIIFVLGIFLTLGFTASFFTQTPNTPTHYWIWAGIRPHVPKKDAVLYIYQGHITQAFEKTQYERLGVAPHPLPHDIYLVYRIGGALPDPETLLSIFHANCARWTRHKVKVLGLQLDFDAPTSKLSVYGNFLEKVRKELPSDYHLSLTGLGDWVLNGQQKDLEKMSRSSNEIVFQLYQGRTALPNIHTYLSKLARLSIPFKIGLLAKDDPQLYVAQVKQNPFFKGTILFIQKDPSK